MSCTWRRGATALRATVVGATLVGATLVSATLSGCHSEPIDLTGDAGIGWDAPIIPRRALSFDGEAVVTLAPLAERTLRVRLADEHGAHVGAAVVAFALEGMPRSSTLRALESVTDAQGLASVVLVAGPLPTTFRLRATSVGAAPLLLDVSVGNEFGTLEVTLEREVTRTVSHYLLRAVADVPCASVPSTPSGDERELAPSVTTTTFSTLPTSASWTMEVRGQNAEGATVARGCVEGIRVSSMSPAQASVVVRDLPLDASGPFLTSWALSAASLGTEARSATLSGAITPTGAGLLLDGLGVALAGSSVADAEVLSTARRAGTLDERLAASLRTEGATLEIDLEPLADEADTLFAALRLEGTLEPGSIPRATGFRALSGDLVLMPTLEASVARLSSVPDRDALAVGGLEVKLGAAATWVAAFEARAGSAGALATALRDGESCASLVSFLAREALLPSCDARCVQAGCGAAAAPLLAALHTQATAFDDRMAIVRYDGVLATHDDDEDLRADRADGDGSARWESIDGMSSTAVSTHVSAERSDAVE